MRSLVLWCVFATVAAFGALYQIGTPCNGVTLAQKLLPFFALALGVLPLCLVRTKLIAQNSREVMSNACVLALLMPFCLWELGYPMLSRIGGIGSP